MFAEESTQNSSGDIPIMSIGKGSSVSCIINLYKQTTDPFKKAISSRNIKNSLNENQLTQIFVEQIDVQIRNLKYSFGVKNQYSDIFYGTKGIPDFYFHKLEEGSVSEPLFVVEAKRLPAPIPPNSREKEYVIGDNKNGGIERYKIGKHGAGLNECGILGFIENNDFNHWKNTINSWIQDQSKVDSSWNISEILNEIETQSGCSYLDSLAIRIAGNLKLHHFWIKTK